MKTEIKITTYGTPYTVTFKEVLNPWRQKEVHTVHPANIHTFIIYGFKGIETPVTIASEEIKEGFNGFACDPFGRVLHSTVLSHTIIKYNDIKNGVKH